MKLLFFFIFFFKNGISPTTGQLSAEVSGEVTVSFMYDPYFNDFKKSCCKFASFGCLLIADTTGFAHGAYKGRIQTQEYNGALVVRIRNLNAGDAGMYRCEITGVQNYYLYKDFQIDVTDRKSRMRPVLFIPKSTISAATSRHHILEKHQEPPSLISDSWSLKQTLGTAFGIVVIILVISVILGAVYHKKKAKDPLCGMASFSSDECGRSLSGVPDIIPVRSSPFDSCSDACGETQPAQELNSIIYTIVDFKHHEDTSQLYANLCLHNTRAFAPDPHSALKSQESVEYSTIARSDDKR